jgi:hypothetical protein
MFQTHDSVAPDDVDVCSGDLEIDDCFYCTGPETD